MSSSEPKKDLTNQERAIIFQTLLDKSENGKLPRGSVSPLAEAYGVHKSTIWRIWKQGRDSMASEQGLADVSHNRTGRCSAPKRSVDEIQAAVSEVPLHKRTTIRSLAAATDIPKSSLFDAKKSGIILRHSSTIKPTLTESNKLKRLRYALSFIQQVGRNRKQEFNAMYNYIHIDEKWFYLTKEKQNFYLLPDEKQPNRAVHSKCFIPKVMFLCAVARPRHDAHRNSFFDGKIGFWPFVETVMAKRKSKNRPAGTPEVKPVSVTTEVYKTLLVDKVFPAIREKFPVAQRGKIIIQQDNAKPHVSVNDPSIVEAGSKESWNIVLQCQPPNSPDFNVLDLGFFSALQNLQYQNPSSNIEELITAVRNAFSMYSPDKLSKNFISLQSVMYESLKVNGSNDYKLPHNQKYQIAPSFLPYHNVECAYDVVEQAKTYAASQASSSEN